VRLKPHPTPDFECMLSMRKWLFSSALGSNFNPQNTLMY